MELLNPPEDCSVNTSLSFTLQVVPLLRRVSFDASFPWMYIYKFCSLFLQICRVEDIDIAGLIQGSVVHFHRARTVIIHSLGTISASGLGIVSYYEFFFI